MECEEARGAEIALIDDREMLRHKTSTDFARDHISRRPAVPAPASGHSLFRPGTPSSVVLPTRQKALPFT
jgi:hypothetical protein